MAKFNKDEFITVITNKVKDAITNNLITEDDVKNNDLERLEGFIQYSLVDYIEDRKFAIDILKDFNYDERFQWEKLESEFGKFKSLTDIALVNLWKFIESQGLLNYEYYSIDERAKRPGEVIDTYDESEFEDDDFEDNDFNDEDDNDNIDEPTTTRRRVHIQ